MVFDRIGMIGNWVVFIWVKFLKSEIDNVIGIKFRNVI